MNMKYSKIIIISGSVGILLGSSLPLVDILNLKSYNISKSPTSDLQFSEKNLEKEDSSSVSNFKNAIKMSKSTERMKALFEVLSHSNLQTLPKFLEELSKPDSRLDENLLVAVITRWAELDAVNAFDYFNSYPNETLSRKYIKLLYRVWVEQDEVRALESISKIDDFQARTIAKQNLVEFLALHNVHEALRIAVDLRENESDNFLIYRALREFAHKDPNSAMDIALTFDYNSSQSKMSAMTNVMSVWVENNREEALAWTSSLKNLHEKEKMQKLVIDHWSRHSPKEAAQYISDLEKGPFRSKLTGSLIYNLADKDPQFALRWVKENTASHEKDYKLKVIFQRWAENNPEDLYKYANEIKSEELRNYGYKQVFESFVKKDLTKAIKLLEDIALTQDTKLLGAILSNSSQTWIQNNPESAIEFLDKIPDGVTKDDFLDTLAHTWSYKNPVDTIEWIETLPKSKSKNRYINSALNHLVQKDLSAASRYVETIQDDPQLASEACKTVFTKWCEYDPEKATTWLLQFEDHITSKFSYNATYKWLQRDVDEALEWLEKLPRGHTRDNSISAVVEKFYLEDPEIALEWAETITDGNARNKNIKKIANNWIRQDKATALSMLKNSSLSSTDIDKIVGDLYLKIEN